MHKRLKRLDISSSAEAIPPRGPTPETAGKRPQTFDFRALSS
jgi:hypothetical protein